MQWKSEKRRDIRLKIGFLLVLCIAIVTGALYSEDNAIDNQSNDNQTTEPKLSDENPSPAPEDNSPSPAQTVSDLISMANQFYSKFTKGKKLEFPNENMNRIHRFALTYDSFSHANDGGSDLWLLGKSGSTNFCG